MRQNRNRAIAPVLLLALGLSVGCASGRAARVAPDATVTVGGGGWTSDGRYLPGASGGEGSVACVGLLDGSRSSAPPRPSTVAAADPVAAEPAIDFLGARLPPPPPGLTPRLAASWRELAAGDAAGATADLTSLPPGAASRADVAALAGYLAYATGDLHCARRWFTTAERGEPLLAATRYGVGLVAEASGDLTAASDWYGRALELDPSLSEAALAQQIVDLRRAQQLLGEVNVHDIDRQGRGTRGSNGGSAPAGDGLDGGKNGGRNGVGTAGSDGATPHDADIDVYERVTRLAPHLLAPYLKLAEARLRRGDAAAAIAVLVEGRRHLGAQPPLLEALGIAYREAGDYAAAVETLDLLRQVDPASPDVDRLLAEARRLHEATFLPESFRNLERAPTVERQDLAALISMRIRDLHELPLERRPQIVTDVGELWTEPHIQDVVALGIMETFPNHTFAPRIEVTRGMLATAAFRVLALIGAAELDAGPRIHDLPRSHFQYEAASMSVGSGVMELDSGRRFRVGAKVSGAEAVRAVERLRELVRQSGPTSVQPSHDHRISPAPFPGAAPRPNPFKRGPISFSEKWAACSILNSHPSPPILP